MPNKTPVILFIDTSASQEITVALKINDKNIRLTSPVDKLKAQKVLPLIDNLLTSCQVELTDLTHIEVNPGPGSFTGLRVGIAVANTLSYTLKIPVNNKKVGEYETPRYG